MELVQHFISITQLKYTFDIFSAKDQLTDCSLAYNSKKNISIMEKSKRDMGYIAWN